MHRRGARQLVSFSACGEPRREMAYDYNLLTLQPEHPDAAARAWMMAMLANHPCLSVTGKLQTERLGKFCCASRPLRAEAA